MRWSRRGIGARLGRLSLDVALSWFMKIWFVGLVPYLIIRGQRYFEAGQYSQAKDSFVIAGGAVIALLISLTPSLIARSTLITLPWEMDFFITLVLYLHVALGGAMGLYDMRLPLPFDKLLHFFSTIMISFLAFMIIFTLYYTRKIRLSFIWMAISIVTAALALGAFWEILEYSLDKIAGTRAQAGLDDTMLDLIMDFFGGILAAIGGTLYARFSKPKHKRRIAIPLAQLFGYLPRPGAESRPEESIHHIIESEEIENPADDEKSSNET